MLASSAHPRRPPSHLSVSLRNPPLSAHPAAAATTTVQRTPPGLEKRLATNNSGESGDSLDRWFDGANNDVRPVRAPLADHDPPYLIRAEGDDEEEGGGGGDDGDGEDDAGSSSTDDFRGVIDDLTVENKMLRRRLRRYETSHDAHLKHEKLFELRFHGLPPAKRRELEDTLRQFAASLHSGRRPDSFPRRRGPSVAAAPPIPPKLMRAHSSQASALLADSAYASMSASARGSSAPGNTAATKRVAPVSSTSASASASASSRHRNIHSYLHDVPRGLLPRPHPTNMTERAKKKFVVRRMEQIFTGKGAAAGGHQQPLQQQEVSQSAARADRSAIEAAGDHVPREGTREAMIMDRMTDGPAAAGGRGDDVTFPTNHVPGPRPPSKRPASDSPDGSPLNQRPTRPLDLDPNRAQVPADNFRYMRHLGFFPRAPGEPNGTAADDGDDDGDDDDGDGAEDHGWIYLNFLINMAQLHTVNVTSDFVRAALDEHSKKLELSPNGRKVRWRGERARARAHSSGRYSSDDFTSEEEEGGGGGGGGEEGEAAAIGDRQSPRKRLKLSHNLSGSRSNIPSERAQRGHPYTPTLFHNDRADGMDTASSSEGEAAHDDAGDDYDDDGPSSWTGFPPAESSAMRTSSGARATAPRWKKSRRRVGAANDNDDHDNQDDHDDHDDDNHDDDDDGPIVFYTNAPFCTDLSGDRRANGKLRHPSTYTTATTHPIGETGARAPAIADLFENRGPLPAFPEEAMDLDGQAGVAVSMDDVVFPAPPPSHATKYDDGVEAEQERERNSPIDLEVTGIGGVAPADNFAVFVRTRHLLAASAVVSREMLRLAPSELPPAIGFADGSDDSDSSSEDDDDGDGGHRVNFHPSRSRAPQRSHPPRRHHHLSSSSSSSFPRFVSSYEDDEDEDDEDRSPGASFALSSSSEGDSVDLLALARKFDPDAIREREREYDAAVAERLAEEIPAGSSAATAGGGWGGSGYGSPVSVPPVI